jgi:Ca-activated chloride channel homolog
MITWGLMCSPPFWPNASQAMKRILLLVLLVAATIAPAGSRSALQDTLKVSVDVVNVAFSVRDRQGRFIPSLQAQDFVVEEDGKRQKIEYFARENELPLTIGVLIDTSPSVRPVFDEEKITAVRFLESILRQEDLALVIGFDRSVTLVQDYTESHRRLKAAIDELEIGGGTSLYDAVYLACQEKLASEAGRKAVILISDGEDTTSKVKFTEALIAAHRSDSVIYSISNSGRGLFYRGVGGGDTAVLKKFSEETGGSTFFVDGKSSFKKIFDQIAQELRSQYSLGYISSNSARDGKYRQIRIVPHDSGYTVKARKGYYAPRDPDRR